jgi:3-carboxy-cis,cis-muconate cycloisomerase
MSVLFTGMVQEHERAVGGWQAEWETLTELLRLAGGAAGRMRETIQGLEVDPNAMRDNLDRTDGLLMAERVTLALAGHMDRSEARKVVQQAARSGRSFRTGLLSDPAIRSVLSADEVDQLLDPAGYLGATSTFIDRALQAHRNG